MANTKETGYIPPYRPAQIYEGETECFVHFSYYSLTTKKYIRKKVRVHPKGLTPAQRNARLLAVKAGLDKVISERNLKNIYHEDVVLSNEYKEPFFYYLKKYASDNKIKRSTRATISSSLFSYSAFLETKTIFKTISPSEFTDHALPEFIQYLKDGGKVGKTINMYIWGMQYVLDQLYGKTVLSIPIKLDTYRVQQLKNETEKYRPLTHNEKEKIFAYFKENDPGFLLYLFFIYYTCVRPAELLRIKIKNIHLDKDKVYIPWYSSKNALSSFVQILGPLRSLIVQQQITNRPKDYFLFSRLFVPGEDQYTGKLASDKWRAGCKKIGIDHTAMMYGLKHTFNVDYVENNRNNIDWEWLRCHNRHATVQQTQDYIRTLTTYMLDETKSIILNYYK